MPSPRGHRFTIYDALDASGYFDRNSANTFARDETTQASLYKGPVEYPKMLYSPDGEEETIRAGEVVVNPLTGPALQNEHRALIHMVVNSKEEEEAALAEGWHPHPALSIRARVEAFIAGNEGLSEREKTKLLSSIPKISSEQRIRDLEAQLEKLLAQQQAEGGKAELDAGPLPPRPLQPNL